VNTYALLDRVGFRSFVRALYRVEVVGAENVPADGACILASNHESLADPFILGVATTREIRYMAKSELFRYGVVAAVLRSLGAFPVDRGGGDRVAFGEAAALLRRGEVLGIFPQGTSKQHRERRWHRGAAKLALATGVPLVPVRMSGTRAWPLRTRVRIAIGRPLVVARERPTIGAARALTAELERAVGAA
jgi:1-acyl-sn-glycerol-3-phosphate acyltransferase